MVKAQIDRERQQFFNDKNVMTEAIKVKETFFRAMVVGAEVSWARGRQAPADWVGAFVMGGCTSVVPQPVPGMALVSVGRPGCTASDAALPRMLALAQILEQGVAVNDVAWEGLLKGAYFYGTDSDFASMLVPSRRSAALLEQIHSDRSSLMQSIRIDLSKPDQPDADTRLPAVKRKLHWLTPAMSPVTGEVTGRVAGVVLNAAIPFAVVVVEFDPKILFSSLSSLGRGTYLVSDPTGRLVVARTAHGFEPPTLSGLGQAGDLQMPGSLDGHFVSFSEGLGDTGWKLTYVFSWQEVVSAIAGHMLLSACMTFAIILGQWATLLLMMKRYFKPIMDRSGRVFESEHLSRTLIETAPIGLSLIAKDSGTPLLNSPTMHRVGTAAVPALLAKVNKDDFSPPEPKKSGTQRIVKPVEIEIVSSSGSANTYSVNVSSARYLGQDILVAAFSDITEQKRIEEYLKDAKQAAESANAAKSNFVAMISHEIRTPLSAIIGNLELLGDSTLNNSQKARLSTIRASSAGLLTIISDVLDISRIGAGQMNLECVPFQVVPVIEQALMLFAPVAAGKGIMLASDIDMEMTQQFYGDKNRLAQVIHNLISNAIKFTESGIVKAIARIEPEEKMLVIEVRDTGIGMTKEQMSRIFEAFVQADASIASRFGGTGLGLFLCQWFVRAMSGSLSVESSVGAGSRFIVRLPLDDRVQITEVTADLNGNVLLLASLDEWHAWAAPQFTRWGLSVRYEQRLDSLDDDEVGDYDFVVMFHDGAAWDQDDEDRIVDAAKWVVDCQRDAPARPVQTGKIITVSTCSITALHEAVRMALDGDVRAGQGGIGGESFSQGGQVPAPRRAVRVLAAEDNPVNAQLLADQLEQLGADALVVNSGAALLAELHSKQWDVLLTDLNMPDMHGDEVCVAVGAELPDLPCIVITAQATADERERCERAGARDILLKPVSMRTLYQLLQGLNVLAPDMENTPPPDRVASIPAHLRASFAETSSKSIEVLRDACKHNNATQMRSELHSLKGMFFMTGCREQGEKCEAMERVLFSGDSDLRADIDELAAQLAGLLATDTEDGR